MSLMFPTTLFRKLGFFGQIATTIATQSIELVMEPLLFAATLSSFYGKLS